MWICGAGVAMVVLGTGALWWSVPAGVTGFGMALLYPNLSAAVADIAPPTWRGSAIGIYRFWRDLGYAIGALGLGLAASLTSAAEAAFWFVAISMFVSGTWHGSIGNATLPVAAWKAPRGTCDDYPDLVRTDQSKARVARSGKVWAASMAGRAARSARLVVSGASSARAS